MAMLDFEKVAQIPTTPKPNTVYFVASGDGFDIAISDKDGIGVKKLNSPDTELDPFLLMGACNG